MTSPPLISVIIRSMDRPSLSAALESVLAQSWRPVEVLVVPASGRAHQPLPLGPQGIAIELADVPAQPLPRPAAANAGLDRARGEWLIFLDDDDVFLPGHLDKLARALEEHPDAVAAYSDVDLGSLMPTGWCSRHRFEADFDPERLRFENYLPMHAVLFRRRCTQAPADCRFDEDQLLFEDWDFWLQLAEHGRFVRAPGVSARYVVAEDAEASGVFTDHASTLAARSRLWSKWQQRMAPGALAQWMGYVQTLYRRAGTADEALSEARASLDGMRQMLAAREAEIAALTARAHDLHAIVAARDTSLADAAAHAAGLLAVIAARETEIRALTSALEAHLAQGPLRAFHSAWQRRTQ